MSILPTLTIMKLNLSRDLPQLMFEDANKDPVTTIYKISRLFFGIDTQGV